MFDFLNKRRSNEKTFRVRITRGVAAAGLDGEVKHRAPGEEFDAPESVAGTLVEAGRAVSLGPVVKTGALAPAKSKADSPKESFTARPVPESYKDLPACFTLAHTHAEKIGELKFKVENAEKHHRAISLTGNERAAHAALEAVLAARDSLRQYRRESYERALFECGRHVMSETSSGNAVRDTLEKVAFSIFAKRVEALELSELKIRSLFEGSALQQRYVFQRIVESDMCSAGDVRYCNAPLQGMASMVFAAREKRAFFGRKLEEATAERDATNAATTTPPRKGKLIAAA